MNHKHMEVLLQMTLNKLLLHHQACKGNIFDDRYPFLISDFVDWYCQNVIYVCVISSSRTTYIMYKLGIWKFWYQTTRVCFFFLIARDDNNKRFLATCVSASILLNTARDSARYQYLQPARKNYFIHVIVLRSNLRENIRTSSTYNALPATNNSLIRKLNRLHATPNSAALLPS